MKTLLGSIAERWQHSATLCRLVPFNRVWTGRIPTPEEVTNVKKYVSIMDGGGRRVTRTNLSRYLHVTIIFHIWVDDSQVADGEAIENAIVDAYAEAQWDFDGGRVIDVLDEGRGNKTQANRPEYRAWQIVKVMTFCLCVPRTRTTPPAESSSGSGL